MDLATRGPLTVPTPTAHEPEMRGHAMRYPNCPLFPGAEAIGYIAQAETVESYLDFGKFKAGGIVGDGYHPVNDAARAPLSTTYSAAPPRA